jgi:hypothetical protein
MAMENGRSRGCRINPAPADCPLSPMNVKGCASRPTVKGGFAAFFVRWPTLDIHSSSQGWLVSGVNAQSLMLTGEQLYTTHSVISFGGRTLSVRAAEIAFTQNY